MKKISFFYILSQIIPTFILGIVIFIFILLMFQFLKLTEFILIYNVSVDNILLLLLNMSMKFLPIILPMSLLFSILLTYSRLSADSEMVAFKSLGYSHWSLSLPAIFFSVIISFLSAQTLFTLGPIATLNFDALFNGIGNQKVISTINEGTFSENFFDLILYTNHVDKEKNVMNDLFIYDKRNPKAPVAIVAKEGRISTSSDIKNQSATILLTDGDMYKLGAVSHTKVKFDNYSLSISSPVKTEADQQDEDTFTLNQLRQILREKKFPENDMRDFESEFHRRIAIAASCLLFGFLGSALGSQTNRRSSASSGFIVSVICIIIYWVLYVVCNNLAKKTDPALALWIPNFIFLVITVWAWRKQATVS